MHHTDAVHTPHSHDFDPGNPLGERGTRRVVLLTAAMMVVEIVAGWLTNSMALLADGWHMGTHVAALGIAAFAYRYARTHANDPRFAFGTGKVGVLGGFTSAIVLGLVALYMAYESVARVLNPVPIRYGDAILVAVIGLAVNLLSAWLLHGHDGHHDHHAHAHGGHSHDHAHGHDLNLRAAYLHVLADALTSVLAIIALLGGQFFGWDFLDPLMGVVGAVVISVWAWGLVRQTSRVLLDREMDDPVVQEIREALEDGDAVIVDLHVWGSGRGSSPASSGWSPPSRCRRRSTSGGWRSTRNWSTSPSKSTNATATTRTPARRFRSVRRAARPKALAAYPEWPGSCSREGSDPTTGRVGARPD